MRGKLITLAAAAVVAATAIAISIVSAASAGPNVTRLQVVERATTDTVVDLTTNGDSTGDLLTFHNDLYDDRDRQIVGSDQGECIRIEVGVSWECRWVNTFDNGSITVEGPFLDAGTEYDFVFRILTS